MRHPPVLSILLIAQNDHVGDLMYYRLHNPTYTANMATIIMDSIDCSDITSCYSDIDSIITICLRYDAGNLNVIACHKGFPKVPSLLLPIDTSQQIYCSIINTLMTPAYII